MPDGHATPDRVACSDCGMKLIRGDAEYHPAYFCRAWRAGFDPWGPTRRQTQAELSIDDDLALAHRNRLWVDEVAT